MKTTRSQMQKGDYAIFHGDMNSGRCRITHVDDSGYEYAYLGCGVGGATRRALDDDRLEACASQEEARCLRRGWLKRHPEAVEAGKAHPSAFDHAGMPLF